MSSFNKYYQDELAFLHEMGREFARAYPTMAPFLAERSRRRTPSRRGRLPNRQNPGKIWELLKALCGAGPVSIREAARRVKRDVKGVHGDVVALLEAGLLVRTKEGSIEFPYETVKVEFLLNAA